MKKIKYIQFGVGPIEEKILSFASAQKNLTLVGAVDKHPSKVGRDIGETD